MGARVLNFQGVKGLRAQPLCVLVAALPLFLLAIAPVEVSAAQATQKFNKSSKLKQAFQLHNKSIHQSIQVVRVKDGEVLFEHDSDRLQTPASVSKLITSAAVLSKYGPEHQFKTKFYRSGPLKNGVIKGDLIIVGDGDPYLVSELLWQFAADLKHLGVREIKGNLRIDNSLFDSVARDASRLAGAKRSSNAYDAPISAFGVNFNTVTVAVAPGFTAGRKALVSLDPYQMAGINIVNKTRTAKGYISGGVKVARVSSQNGNQTLVANGMVSQNKNSLKKFYRSIGNHLVTSGEYVRSFLRAEGIFIKGKVKAGKLSSTDALLYELPSYHVSKIVKGLNRFSNNYIADVLVKRMGASFPRRGKADAAGQGSYQNGLSVLKDFLQSDVGIKSKFVMKNGSGLSTENKLSSAQLCQLLRYMAKDMTVFPEYLASLPASGRSGTLKKRFSQLGLSGKIRAKTGTLQQPISVSSLAGYFQHPTYGLVAFSVMQNGIRGKKQPGIDQLRRIQDAGIYALVTNL